MEEWEGGGFGEMTDVDNGDIADYILGVIHHCNGGKTLVVHEQECLGQWLIATMIR